MHKIITELTDQNVELQVHFFAYETPQPSQ